MDTLADETVTNAAVNADGGEQPSSLVEISEGPASLNLAVGPPSPLTGCYLLIVIGDPYSHEHKDIILQKLLKGLLSWNVTDCHVNLEEELSTITALALEGEEGKNGERLIQYASENLVTEVLIHPQTNTFIQCMRNLLSSFTRHRHIIHAGYTFTGNGSWILQDGTFSVLDFCDEFLQNDVQRVLRAYADTISIDIHCAQLGHWSSLPDKNFTKLCKIRINPVDVLDSGNDKLNAFVDYLSTMVTPGDLNNLLESSDIVGNIRFSHPTLYVFPGGQGDAALFGINGFNMLVDGGFPRKACFWDFVRHLDRLDAVLMTRLNNSNICGMSAVVERKSVNPVYPQIGHFFTNIPANRAISSPDGDKDRNPLELDLIEEGGRLITNLKTINLKPQSCYRDAEPINLYHKVGHGTLDMYIISPSKDSKEVKEFLQKWHANDQKLFASKDSKEFSFPIQNVVSICALLVWQPANPDDNITRILFPGSTPDAKIFEGLEKVKTLEFLKHPICTVKTVTPSLSTSILSKKALKAEKILDVPMKAIKQQQQSDVKKAIEAMDEKLTSQPDNRLIEEQIQEHNVTEETKDKREIIEKVVTKTVTSKTKSSAIRQIKTDVKKVETKKSEIESAVNEQEKGDKEETDGKSAEGDGEVENVTVITTVTATAVKKEEESDVKPKAKISKPKTSQVKSRIDSRPPKSIHDRKSTKKDEKDQKSSPTTPKKTATDNKIPNGTAIAVKEAPVIKEQKIKAISRTLKDSPKVTPAKSTKDANNRKVLEAHQKPSSTVVATASSRVTKVVEEKKIFEKKTVAKRTMKKVGSPMKASRIARDGKKINIKGDKSGTTDSSLVSTPSADDVQKKIITGMGDVDDVVKQKELNDLKEEQEAVREIEAVFKKDQEKRRSHGIILDHRELHESTTEAEEEEEYLIIEKEEPYTEDSINEHESHKDEGEIQKLQRDSDESEKKLKDDSKEKEPNENEEADENNKNEQEEQEEEEVNEEMKEEIQVEVQEIITSAKEIATSKMEISVEGLQKTEEMSLPSHDDIKKTSADDKDEEVKEINKDEIDPIMIESQPEEKFSATSGATTAPTMPEDEVKESPPLEEIKEDLAVEEKYIKEETKENEIVVTKIPTVFEPLKDNEKKTDLVGQSGHLRDIVKTPDEVADLPMHEVVDYQGYVEYSGKKSEKIEEVDEENDKNEIQEKAFKVERDEEKSEEEKAPEINESENDPEIEEEKAPQIEKSEKAPEIEEEKVPKIDENQEAHEIDELEKAPEIEEEKTQKIDESEKISQEEKYSEEKALKVEDEDEEEDHQKDVAKEEIEVIETVEQTFASEIRETHITTVESPVADSKKSAFQIEEIKFMPIEREDSGLNDIKEEDDELGTSPPKHVEDDEKLSISPSMPPRAKTPEQVMEIVAKVAEVLKTDKDLEDLVPDFDPKEYERRLSSKAGDDEFENDVETTTTVQRMLVTASSEDGGVETEICPQGSINFVASPEKSKMDLVTKETHEKSPPSSGKSSPDLKTSTVSAEEKDKNEIQEKEVIHAAKVIETQVSKIQKEEFSLTEIRRESAISVFSEKDYTKEESSFVIDKAQSRSQSITSNIMELDHDEHEKLAEIIDEEKSRPQSQASVASEKEVIDGERKVSISSVKSDEKLVVEKEERSPSQASAASDKIKSDENLPIESDDRKESIISTKSEEKINIEKEPSRPQSQASNISEKNDKIEERKESTASIKSEEKLVAEKDPSRSPSQASDKEVSRPQSQASEKIEETLIVEKQERSPSQASVASEKDVHIDDRKESIASIKLEEKLAVEKEESKPLSQTSNFSEKDVNIEERKESIVSIKSEEKLAIEKEDSRPHSQVSDIDDKDGKEEERKDSIKLEEKLSIEKEPSRPASQTSVISERDIQVDDRKESIISTKSEEKLNIEKEPSRPQSQASNISEKNDKIEERKESIASIKSQEKLVAEKDPSRSPSQASDKEGSRPQSQASEKIEETLIVEKQERSPSQASVASEKDVKIDGRKESVASIKLEEKLAVEKEESRTPSQTSNFSEKDVNIDERKESIVSIKSEEKLTIEKEDSRPHSQVSDIDDKDGKEEERKDSIKPEEKLSIGKELSRPASQASVISEKDIQVDDRKGSIISTKSEEKLNIEKEPSRPQSQASNISEKNDKIEERKESIASIKSEEKLVAEKDPSRSPSQASNKEESRPQSQASEKIEETLIEEKQERSPSQASVASEKDIKISDRKESVASIKAEEKLAVENEDSRPHSQASAVSDKDVVLDERKESVISLKSDEKLSFEKEDSRPHSQASVTGEKNIQVDNRKESIISSKSEEKLNIEKVLSRPQSQASNISEKDDKIEERKESIASIKSEEKLVVEKDPSRSPSQASDKEGSRPQSQASEKIEETLIVEKQERSLSQGSVASEKDMQIEDRKESVASIKLDEKLNVEKELSRPQSQASIVSEKNDKIEERKESTASIKSEEKLVVEKDSTRSSSQATDKKESRPQSQASEKIEETLIVERHASITSEKDVKIDERKESIISEEKLNIEKEDSRPQSQPSGIGDKVVKEEERKDSIKPEEKLLIEKEPSRPASQASYKESSRPQSQASEKIEETFIVDKQERSPSQASVASEKDVKIEDRKESIISEEKLVVEKVERSPSLLSEKDDERKESIASIKSEERLTVDKEERSPSQASAASDKVDKIEESKESIVLLKLEEKFDIENEELRSQSQNSHISDKEYKIEERKESIIVEKTEIITTVTTSITQGIENIDDRRESIISSRPHSPSSTGDPKEDHKVDEQINDDFERPHSPASVGSHVSEKAETHEEITDDVNIRRKSSVSVASDVENVPVSYSRPETPPSATSDKDFKIEERKESIISLKSEKEIEVKERKESIVTEEIIVERKESIKRPLSPSSTGGNDDQNIEETQETDEVEDDFERPHSPASVGSHVSEKEASESKPIDEVQIRRKSSVSAASDVAGEVQESFSRPETPPSAAHDDFEDKKENDDENDNEERRESISKTTDMIFELRRDSQKSVDDSFCRFPVTKDFDTSDDKIFMKETRSKSVSSVCSTSSRTDDFGKLSAIEEILAASREDLKPLTTIILKEESSKLITATDESTTSKNETTITSFPLTSDKLPSQSFPLVEEKSEILETTRTEIITITSTISSTSQESESVVKIESTEIISDSEGKKTPPTVPVSPNVASQQKANAQQKELEMSKASEIIEKSEFSTPRDSIHSGKSSPDSAVSRSTAIGHGSAVESPDSSPKPTSPFPKNLESNKAEEEIIKTASGISSPEMTRTSTPDTTEKLIEIKASTEKKEEEEKEVSEFKSKVHTQDFTTSYQTEQKIFFDQKLEKSSFHTSEWSSDASQEQQYESYGEEDDEIPPQYDSEEVKSAITIASSFKADPMSTSFYGTLPESTVITSTTSDHATSVPIPISTTTVTRTYVEYTSSPDTAIETTKSFTKYLDDSDLDFEKTFQQQSAIVTTITSQTIQSSSSDTKESTPSIVTTTTTTTTSTKETIEEQPTSSKDEKLWEKPLGLPSPAPTPPENDVRTTPKRERKLLANKNKLNLQKRSQSPMAGKKLSPIYMDLAYVPHHGNSYYTHVEFFKKIRARYYVFSGTEPSKEVYNALLEAKQTWEDKNLEVTIIPTYDTDVLGYWVSENEELLAKYHIDLSPSAARCTINLQDHETSCSAYRLEF